MPPLSHADEEGCRWDDGNSAPGMKAGEMRIAGDDQLGFCGCGKCEEFVVFRVGAVIDRDRHIEAVCVLNETVKEFIALGRRGVAVELGACQYGS